MKELQSQLKSYLSHPLAWIIGGIACCLITLGYCLSAQQKQGRLVQAAFQLKKRQEWTASRDHLEKKLLHQLQIADRDYIEKELESLKFLNPEVKKIQALLHTDPTNTTLIERLQFLESAQNLLLFREQNFQRLDGFQEVEVIQDHPVEMNRDDLKTLLTRIENQNFGNPPDLMIKKFELVKKPMSSTEETYLINLELTKFEISP